MNSAMVMGPRSTNREYCLKVVLRQGCWGLGQTGFVLKTEHSQTPLGFPKPVVSCFF